MMRTGSLTLRLFLLTSLFALVGITLIAIVLSQLYRANAEGRFRELLTAHLYNLMGSVELDEDGNPVELSDMRDPRFSRYASGWYWTVNSLSDPAKRLASPSLAGASIPAPEDVPFDSNFQRQYSYTDSSDQNISVIEGQVYLGDSNEIFVFRVSGNRSEIAEETDAFVRRLILLLGLFAIGFVAASYGIVTLGLRPITGATRRLADIREGRAQRLEGVFPREIAPLIEETNTLIESNRRVVERARTQVGNLAHSLKTPIAILQNEAANLDTPVRRLIVEQTSLMKSRVDSYLNRARIAARHGTITSRTETGPVIERLVRVISKLNPDLKIELAVDDTTSVPAFAGEQQDLEEILGNLLENAARFAKSQIIVTPSTDKLSSGPALALFIEDDGRGMNEDEIVLSLKRGMRLDETAPGSGLGLAIVKDIVAEYDGTLSLDKSSLGGLRVHVTLPAR
jgi:signal transduction histidine kinase